LISLRFSGILVYAYSAGGFRFRLRFRESAPVGAKRIVQADSGSDSDSESRNKNEEMIPVNHSLRRLAPNLGIRVGT
jgi:hypothetical protein